MVSKRVAFELLGGGGGGSVSEPKTSTPNPEESKGAAALNFRA